MFLSASFAKTVRCDGNAKTPRQICLRVAAADEKWARFQWSKLHTTYLPVEGGGAAEVHPLIGKLAVSAIGGLLCCLSVEELKEGEGEWEGAH